ncbi:tetratricopeptide repeat-containing protein [Xanthomonas axonopodis]
MKSNGLNEAGKLKVCFVIMGFGKKTDYPSGRTLDLDATYTEIIKPAIEAAGLKCIRADEIVHSGVIDVRMYELLLRADLVVADISTGNQNAIYELGVRHALRPYSTIIMMENGGSFYFDLNHTSTLTYRHLGEDIGVREAKRVQSSLQRLAESALADPRADSPVYTHLPNLRTPVLTEEQVEEIVIESEKAEIAYFSAHDDINLQIKNGNFVKASESIREVLTLRPREPFLLQQLALSIYKSKHPSEILSLLEAWALISELKPIHSNDPETLGIAGSIQKRMWNLTKDAECLKLASELYGRGFDVRRDYYTGENHALCLNLLASQTPDDEESTYYRIDARKVREKLKVILNEIVEDPDFLERTDIRWVYASYANTLFGLGDHHNAQKYEKLFYERATSAAAWEVESYQEGKSLLLKNINKTAHG